MAAALTVILAVAPGGAAPTGGIAGAADTLETSPAPAVRRPPLIWWTTVRSGLVPGWGQLANGKPLKAVILAGLDAYWLAGALHYESERKAAGSSGDAAGVNRAVDRRNFRFWMMGATALYAMLDAYVDAHFFDYDQGWTGRLGLDAGGRPEVRLMARF